MTDDRGAAALAACFRLVTKVAKPAYLSTDVQTLVAAGAFMEAALAILGEQGVFLPEGRAIENAAIDVQTERDMAEAYYRTLEAHLRNDHQCEHSFVDVADEAALSPEPKP